jgi:MFS family permease
MRRMKMADIVVVIVGIVLAISVIVIVWRTFREIDKVGWKQVENYDERQVLMRGKAFQAGFVTSFFSSLFFGILTCILDDMKVYAPNFLFISAFAGITVFAVIAIWNDAFITDKISAKRYFLLYFFIGIACLAGWIMNKDWDTFSEFLSSENLYGLLTGISFITIAVLIAVKAAREQRGDNR